MSHDYGNCGRLDKQRSKQPVIDSESPALIPKRSRTKVKCSKVSTYGVLSNKAKRSSDPGSLSLAKIFGNISHLFPGDSLQKYIDKFLYKLVDPEYHVIVLLKGLIHWIVVKILARKPGNSTRANDSDLFFMWCIIQNRKMTINDWVRFIIDRMIYCRDNPKRPIYFSSFFMMILKLNGIECKEAYLIESPKILDYGDVAKMRYYKDSNGHYYYLEDFRRHIYDDKILEKEVTGMTDPSTASGSVVASIYVHVKELLDYVLQIFFADNQIREDRIMENIDALVNVS
ncbi:hypothetical protein KIW84_035580 [Lathyrus oleraceus]|uniref:Uncharacterized protein n=1 Tax=Pisum sativum TaxID=3888 RepID=A0A9D4Y321_PEA|nr:hypothetical protein KIW84_035580 [Pisum sativum]